MFIFRSNTNQLCMLALCFLAVACAGSPNPEIEITESEAEVQLPLIYQMAFMHTYSEKLYFAGMEENWELADIYSHEMEEVSEAIIAANDIDDEINRSKLLESMLLPRLEEIESAIDNRDLDAFKNKYQTMINTCNQCHQAANYGVIKIIVPEINRYNQDFSK